MRREDISILVIDDTEAMRARIKDLLYRLGFRLTATADGPEDANKVLEKGKIHLILCDWNMDPVDGKAFLLQLRARPECKNIAFIMVTAESTIEKVTEAIKGGVDDYLVKPFSQDQLESKIQSVLTRKQLL